MADGSITTLLNSGIDAFNNLYDVKITFPTSLELRTTMSSNSVSVRALGFTPPELSLQTVQVDYKAIQLTRQVPKIVGDRTFTLEFRMDAEYDLYYNLAQWKHIWVDPSGESNVLVGGLGEPTFPTNYGTVNVMAYSALTPVSGYSDSTPQGTNAVTWDFFDVICSKIGTPTFTRAGADFVTVTAEFIFGRMNEPGTSLKTDTEPYISPDTGAPVLTSDMTTRQSTAGL
jgi:hypothetical protein